MAKSNIRTSIRVGGASGFWGDAGHATHELLSGGDLDFIVYDYLAEITMAILARARAKDPSLGFAGEFVTSAMAPNLTEIARQGVRIVSNAGGINPMACAAALKAEIARLRLNLTVATVMGDDLSGDIERLASAAPVEMFSGQAFPPSDKIGSVNAYLGAFPIAKALDRGADIVVTGRCVDSAVTLGAAIHAFGWDANMLDEMAGGSLAGHILECGPQATGGNFTDWDTVPGGPAAVGYPIAEIAPDGVFTVSKVEGTGGLVSPATVGEQLLYEIGDPAVYVLPDVICDFSDVCLEQDGTFVRVSGAKGCGIPDNYKTCLTWQDGYRGGTYFTFYGLDAAAKARTFADAALARTKALLKHQKMPDFTRTSVEVLGAEDQFGALGDKGDVREVVAKLAARHDDARAVGALLKEATGLALAAPPGLSGFAGTRPRPSPVLALFSFLTPKDSVGVTLSDDQGVVELVQAPAIKPTSSPKRQAPQPPVAGGAVASIPLIRLAYARSGDKGNKANIGVIARDPVLMPWIWHAMTDGHLDQVFGHFRQGGFAQGGAERFFLPGMSAMNIVLSAVLDGGGTSSLRNDPQAKGFAQLLLAAPIPVDTTLLEALT